MKRLMGRSLMLATILVVAAPFSAHAQGDPGAATRKFPRAEIFVGFSYTNAKLGSQSNLFAPAGQNYYGVHPSLKLNLRKNISVLMEAGGGSGPTRLVSPYGFDTQLSLDTWQALFGPEFTLRRRKFNAFAHSLVGVNSTHLSLNIMDCWNVCSKDLVTRRNLALGFGGGLDINWKRHFAVRLFQADYIPTRVDGKWEPHFRASTGLVLKF